MSSNSLLDNRQQFGYTDEALSAIGFGKFQYIVLAYAGLGWIAEAMEMTLLSFVGPAIQPEWGLSPSQQNLISTVTFIGMLVGAYSWGVVSDSYGRKRGFLGAAIIAIIAGILSAFAPNYISLLILRCFAGVGLGCGHVFPTWFVEFVPTSNRGTWMVIFSTFWTLGSIMEAPIAWWIMPRYGWRWLVGLSAIPYLVALLFYPLVPESPRYLYTQGRLTEAYSILRKGAELNKKELPEMDNSDESAQSESLKKNKNINKPIFSSMRNLLKRELIKTTLLIWCLYFANTFSYYGIILLTSQLSIGQGECDRSIIEPGDIVDESLYINVFITSIAELPGLALAGFILDRVGRKRFMEMMIGAGFILLLPLVVHQNAIVTTILLFGARMFMSASYSTVCIYAPEAFPTDKRATGVGIATAIGRFGVIVCPMIAVAMGTGCHQTPPVVLFEVIILLQGLAVVLLPLETTRRGLEDNTDLPTQPNQLE